MAAERLQTKVQYAAIPETERETALYHFHCADRMQRQLRFQYSRKASVQGKF